MSDCVCGYGLILPCLDHTYKMTTQGMYLVTPHTTLRICSRGMYCYMIFLLTIFSFELLVVC